MSQLLERLRRDLERQVDPAERAETTARMAIALARIGQFDGARGVIRSIREQFGQGQSGRVTVWLMLAEGLIHHYEDLNPAALDRINRAQLLASAMRYKTVVALSSTWRAHILFEQSDFQPMLDSIALAVANVDETDFDAQTRLAIVLSNSFMICGDKEQSHKWFMQGHGYAIRNGDQASVDALLYNRAAFYLAWFRALNCVEPVSEQEIARVRREIDSATNLQKLTQISALSSHVMLLDARLMALESRHEDAICALEAVRRAEPFARHNFDQKFVDLEIRFNRMMLGVMDVAAEDLPVLGLDTFSALDIDEQIVAMYMLGRMATIDPRFGNPNQHQEQLNQLWSRYSAERASLRQSLSPFAR